MMGLMERFEDFYITWYSRAKLFAREYVGEVSPDFCHEQARGEKQYQIAEELNISVNTVETQMALAYKKLRNELKDCLPFLAFLYSIA